MEQSVGAEAMSKRLSSESDGVCVCMCVLLIAFYACSHTWWNRDVSASRKMLHQALHQEKNDGERMLGFDTTIADAEIEVKIENITHLIHNPRELGVSLSEGIQARKGHVSTTTGQVEKKHNNLISPAVHFIRTHHLLSQVSSWTAGSVLLTSLSRLGASLHISYNVETIRMLVDGAEDESEAPVITYSQRPTKSVSLPWELYCLIFSFADQPTLLALCLVSFEVLQVTGPLLYGEIELKDWDSLDALFVETDFIKSTNRLFSSLSLSNTRHLTITTPAKFTPRRTPHRPASSVPTRLSSLPPLQLSSFHLKNTTRTSHPERFRLFSYVFPSVNPVHFECAGCPQGDLEVDDRTGAGVDKWNRLRTVRLAGLFPASMAPSGTLQFLFRTLPPIVSTESLEQSTSSVRGRSLIWDFKTQPPRDGSDWFSSWTEAIRWLKLFEVFEVPSPWAEGVRIEVGSERQKDAALETIRLALSEKESGSIDVVVV